MFLYVERIKDVELLAKVVSAVLCPPLTATVAALALVSSQSIGAIESLGRYLFLSIIFPVVGLALLVKVGKVSNFDLTERKERWKANAVAVVGVLGAWVLSLRYAEADPLRVLIACHAMTLLLLSVITLFWKISYHSAIASVMSTVLLTSFGPAALISVLLVLLTAWSRMKLGCHTFGQVVCGACLGTATSLFSTLLCA